MTNFEKFKHFFDQIPLGSFITRQMMLDFFEKRDHSSMENVRCHMMRAGYICDWKREDILYGRGIYFKSKELPIEFNGNKLKKEAYVRND